MGDAVCHMQQMHQQCPSESALLAADMCAEFDVLTSWQHMLHACKSKQLQSRRAEWVYTDMFDKCQMFG